MHQYRLHLRDLFTRKQLAQAGYFQVVEAGGTAKLTLQDLEGNSASNPKAISSGAIEFQVATTYEQVDIYYMTDKGYCGVLKGVQPGAYAEALVDTNRLDQTLIVPFDATDDTTNYAAGSEISTGFVLPDEVSLMPYGTLIDVATIDATETLTVGTDSTSGTNDPDGLLVAMSVATLGIVHAAVGFDVGSNAVFIDLTGGDAEFTYGALYCATGTRVALAEGSDTNADEGFYLLTPHVVNSTVAAANKETLTITPSSGTDTAAGFIHLPMRLPRVAH